MTAESKFKNKNNQITNQGWVQIACSVVKGHLNNYHYADSAPLVASKSEFVCCLRQRKEVLLGPCRRPRLSVSLVQIRAEMFYLCRLSCVWETDL